MLLYTALSIVAVNALAVTVIARLGRRLSRATDEHRRAAVARANDTAPASILRVPVSLQGSPHGAVFLDPAARQAQR